MRVDKRGIFLPTGRDDVNRSGNAPKCHHHETDLTDASLLHSKYHGVRQLECYVSSSFKRTAGEKSILRVENGKHPFLRHSSMDEISLNTLIKRLLSCPTIEWTFQTEREGQRYCYNNPTAKIPLEI